MQLFEPIELIQSDTKVELEWIGEGLSGDYDPEDPDDVPLLRFSVCRKHDGDWQEVENASYCTQIDARTNDDILQIALGIIMSNVEGVDNPIRICEQMSWMSAEKIEELGAASGYPSPRI